MHILWLHKMLRLRRIIAVVLFTVSILYFPNVRGALKDVSSIINREIVHPGISEDRFFSDSLRDAPSHTPSTLTVTSVIDGDTVIINGERVRLIGIDAPESGQLPWGPRATEHLKDILSGNQWKVKVETDVQKRDRYGRILAYLWIDGRLINLEMVRDGYAVVLTIPPNVKYAERFVKAQKYARENRKGFWAEGGLEKSPSEYRKERR